MVYFIDAEPSFSVVLIFEPFQLLKMSTFPFSFTKYIFLSGWFFLLMAHTSPHPFFLPVFLTGVPLNRQFPFAIFLFHTAYS